ncbi:MAG: hypothetical protein WB780_22225 [Candidatus Acidiferrales bacterium]
MFEDNPMTRSDKVVQVDSAPVPVATARVLVRNLESDTNRLQFAYFSIETIETVRDLDAARRFFPEAMRDEWLLIRDYDAIPPAPEAWSGFGAIPNDVEDLLLLLRLYRPGDLAFVGFHVTTPTASSRQYPYRAISNLVSNHSTRPFRLNQAECASWEQFEAPLRMSPQWNSTWFEVCRRFLLYAGGKEFNPNFQGDVDRVIDYMTALEAAIVPESDFVSRRLRERAKLLLSLQGEAGATVQKLLTDMYGIRSTLVHGSALNEEQLSLLRDRVQWWKFEQIARDLVVAALRTVPSNDTERRSQLASIYDLCDEVRAEKLRQDFTAIKNDDLKQQLIRTLAGTPEQSPTNPPLPLLSTRPISRLWRKWKWRFKRALGFGEQSR